jgi:hypothetical protein
MLRGHGHEPGGITCLLKTSIDGLSWIPLESGKTEYIEQNSVYTCTSSPEGLGLFHCFEDSYASIGWDSTQRQWHLTPHIQQRIPKRWAAIVSQEM